MTLLFHSLKARRPSGGMFPDGLAVAAQLPSLMISWTVMS